MQLNDLVKRAHSNALEKGWWENGDRPWREIFMLIVSEVAEATEQVRKGRPPIYKIACDDAGNEYFCPPNTPGFAPPSKPEGEAVELADVCIRIFDWCGRKGWDFDLYAATYEEGERITEAALSPLEQHFEITKLITAGEFTGLVKAALVCFCRIRELGVDPIETIELKMAFNATRPHRHGNKKY